MPKHSLELVVSAQEKVLSNYIQLLTLLELVIFNGRKIMQVIGIQWEIHLRMELVMFLKPLKMAKL